MLNTIEKDTIKNYNNIIQIVNNFLIAESSNIYGHCKEFIRLPKNIKHDAHRVISQLAVLLYSKEDIYSVNDINGITYKFDIFEDGNYRVIEVRKFKDKVKEDINEKYSKKNN